MTSRDNPREEGGHMSSRFGRIVRTTDARLPYKAILTHDQCAETDCSFATMREAEAFIGRNTPRPQPRKHWKLVALANGVPGSITDLSASCGRSLQFLQRYARETVFDYAYAHA